MFSYLALIAAALALVWSARYYTDFIARDPYNFDHTPAWYARWVTMLLLTSPFLLLTARMHIVHTILFNALLSLAVSTLVVPAVFANRTGEGGTWLANMVEKSLAAALLALFVSFLTSNIPTWWWYIELVLFGAFSMRSRRLLLLLSVQDKEKPTQWNDMRVRAMRTFISLATIAYWILAIGLGALVQHSHVGADSWNKGIKQLWQLVLKRQ